MSGIKGKGPAILERLREADFATDAELLDVLWPRGRGQWREPKAALYKLIEELRDAGVSIERISGYRLRRR